MDDVTHVIETLTAGFPLSAKYSDHPLKGRWSGFRECHVRPDLLMIYQIKADRLILVRLGSHAELFE